MSMRINSLFEHDDLMKRQAEQNDNTAPVATMTSSNSNFENSMAEQQGSQTKQSSSNSNSGKPATQRHRASIACASCRDRRIRVSDRFEEPNGWICLTVSVCCTTRGTRLHAMQAVENRMYH